MLGEIKLAAARKKEKAVLRRVWRPALAICAALLLCIGIYAQTGDERGPLSPVPSNTVLDSQTAGSGEQATTLMAGGVRALLDVPPGSITVGGEKETPAYRNLFAKGQGSNFPLVTVGGATYRMLKTPASIQESLLGDSLGQVTEYTLEPALSTGGAVSNVVSQGETVYAVQGMKGAMAAALVEGTLRVFQRVSFAGGAIVGNEGLEDTLCAASQVVSMELSDVGVIDDAQRAQELMQVLLDNASYQSASISSGGSQSLVIEMDNGLSLQLMVGEDTVSACGSWSCPEFFEEFIVAME
jgi:hypothetical protein